MGHKLLLRLKIQQILGNWKNVICNMFYHLTPKAKTWLVMFQSATSWIFMESYHRMKHQDWIENEFRTQILNIKCMKYHFFICFFIYAYCSVKNNNIYMKYKWTAVSQRITEPLVRGDLWGSYITPLLKTEKVGQDLVQMAFEYLQGQTEAFLILWWTLLSFFLPLILSLGITEQSLALPSTGIYTNW